MTFNIFPHYKENFFFDAGRLILAVSIFAILSIFPGETFGKGGVSIVDEVDIPGYNYVHKAISEKDQDVVAGVIEVSSSSGELLLRLTGFPPGKCDDFSVGESISAKFSNKLAERYVVLCGSDEGRRNSIAILKKDAVVTELYFGDSKPALTTLDGGYSFISPVYKRFLQRDGSLMDALLIYEWSPISEINQFVPIFNTKSAQYYLSYYHDLQKKMSVQQESKSPEPLVAALIASSETIKICEELTNMLIPEFGVNEIDEAMSFIEKYGFPHFDRQICLNRR